jgi:hypothetical protein
MVNVFPDTKGKVFLYAGDVNTPVNLRAQYEWGVQDKLNSAVLYIERLSDYPLVTENNSPVDKWQVAVNAQ